METTAVDSNPPHRSFVLLHLVSYFFSYFFLFTHFILDLSFLLCYLFHSLVLTVCLLSFIIFLLVHSLPLISFSFQIFLILFTLFSVIPFYGVILFWFSLISFFSFIPEPFSRSDQFCLFSFLHSRLKSFF